MRSLRWVGVALILAVLAMAVPSGAAIAQDSTAVGPPGVPSSLTEFVTQYQLVLATVISSALLWLAAKGWPGVAAAGDWTKRIALVLAGMGVSAVLKAIGGTLSPDLASLIATGLSGLASAVTGATVFRLAKSQPGNS
ncbi:MAG: hypothetical protein HOP28_12190 [Gemmatimonadales bacterium]|nr:hypothetical protein [Gemmatimonadales bacterium]